MNDEDVIDQLIKEKDSLRRQLNMWQSAHAKIVLETCHLREEIDKAIEEIKDTFYVDSLIFGELMDFRNGKISADDVIEEFNKVARKDVLDILKKHIGEE